MFLLTGESGEYEQRHEVILGLFESRSDAMTAATEFAKQSELERNAHQAFNAEVSRRAALNGFPDVEILKSGGAAWHARFAECQRIEAEMGGAPAWRYFPERYAIVEVPVGEFVNIMPEYDNERPRASQ